MVKRYKGGLMGSTEAVTSTSDARGMWGTVQSTQARNTGNWPALLTTETPGSGSGAGFANGFMTVSNVAVTDSSYNVLDDTPNISTAGGYIKLTGRGFVSGCVVYVGGTPATSTTFISSTEVRAQIAAATSNTLMVYVVNPDGSTGIKLSSLVFSGTPSWDTSETLTTQITDVAFSIYFSATSDSAVTYTLSSGSTLPAGTSLFANGLFTGTVTGISSDTTYSFSVDAIDAENQDTSRTFSVTVSSGDAYFYLTSLLLNGESSVWIRDSSANNFLPTIGNDTKPSAFSPYNTSWSGYFDGSGDYLSVSNTAVLNFGSGAYTIEFWYWGDGSAAAYQPVINGSGGLGVFVGYNSGTSIWNSGTPLINPTGVLLKNAWNFIQIVRTSTASNGLTLTVNGTTHTGTDSATWGTQTFNIAYDSTPRYVTGYLADLRISDVARTVAIPTSKFVSDANTKFLTCQSNRFIDSSSNAVAITKNGDAATKSFSPFVETDIITGSAYFDGTGDYLTIADNAALELGSGDFCVECWIYPTSVAGTAVVIDKRSGGYAPILLWRSTSTLQLYSSLNGSSWGLANGVTVGTLTVNQWYHVAIFRVGSSLYTAFNGTVTLVTASGSGTLVNNATNWYIGTETNGSTNPWSGYIADMRFVVGSGVYTSANFTPATSSLSSVTNTQFLSLQYRTGDNNHRFIDEAGPKAIVTRAGNASQGTFSPFSPAGWSGYYDGTGDYLTAPANAEWAFGTGDFTLEAWVFLTANQVANSNIVTNFSNPNGWFFSFNTSPGNNYPMFTTYTTVLLTATSAVSLNTWTHLAAVRSGTTLTIYINGTASGSTTNSSTLGDASAVLYSGFNGISAYFNGYISNLRVIKGLAVYTGNFTPSTTILANTQSSGSNISAITSGSSFLTLQNNRFVDNGKNALSVTRSGDAKIQAFSPFRGSGTYVPATHGGSAYFDGSGDYVYVTQSSTMTLGTNNHCIEFWMYPNGTQNQYSVPWYYNGSIVYYFGVGSDSNQAFLLVGGGSPWSLAITIGSTDYLRALNNWTHVVITRSGTAFRVFYNGVLVGYGTTAQSISAQTSAFSLGWDGTNATTYYKGWLSGFRVINGSVPTAYQTAVTTTGTSVFTPPTAVPAFEANTAMVMNFTNGGIIDATGRQNFETVADAKISNVASKFGIGSLYFDGTGDYLYAATSTNLIYPSGLGDITIEAWVNPSNFTNNQTIFFINGGTTGYAGVRLDINSTSGYLTLLISTSGSSHAINSTSATALTAGSWKHVAVVRSGGTFTVYMDGVSVITSSALGATTAIMSGTQHVIAAHQNSSYTQNFTGYLDDLRITRYARTITLPTQAHLTR